MAFRDGSSLIEDSPTTRNWPERLRVGTLDGRRFRDSTCACEPPQKYNKIQAQRKSLKTFRIESWIKGPESRSRRLGSRGRLGCARRARIAGRGRFVARAAIIRDVKSRTFEEKARAATNPALHLPLAPLLSWTDLFWALGQRLIAHPLRNVELRLAFQTNVFVGWHN
jgi:hypothetical protein